MYALLKDIADNHKDADHFSPSNPVVDYFKILDILSRHIVDALPEQEHSEKVSELLGKQIEVLQKRIAEFEEKPQYKDEKNRDISEMKMGELYHEIRDLTREIGRLEKSLDTLNLDHQELKNHLDKKENIIHEIQTHLKQYEGNGIINKHKEENSYDTTTISGEPEIKSEKSEFEKLFAHIGFYCKCGWSGENAVFNPDITGSYACPECGGPVYTKIEQKHETGEKFEWGGKIWEYCRIGDPYPHEWIVIEHESGNVRAVIKPGSLNEKYRGCWIVKPVNSTIVTANHS